MKFPAAPNRLLKRCTSFFSFSRTRPTSRKPPYAWVTFPTLFVALSCLVGIWFVLEDQRENALQAHFHLETQRITGKISDRMTAYTEILRGAAGLFAASENVNRDEWRAYVEKLDLDQSYRGIQGVGFALFIPADKLKAHIAAMHREGFADYVVKPEGVREHYSSIIYLEPFSGRNLRAFGYDMYSEPTRRAAMELARDSGAIAISGKVRLLQETKVDVQAGILAYHPVYAKGMVLQTVEQRRASLIGWTYSPYRMNDLMDAALKGEINNLRLEIFDGEALHEETRLFDSESGSKMAPMAGAAQPLSLTVKLELEGRAWSLRYTTLPGFAVDTAYASSWLETIGLAVIGLLLMGISWALYNTRQQAELIAERLTASLRESEARYRSLATVVPVGIFRTNQEGRCIYANQRWLDIAGLTEDAVKGEGWVHALHPDDRPRVIDEWNAAVQDKQMFKSEYRFLNPAGTVTWVLGTASAEIGSDNEVIGYTGSVTDITERKKAEEALRQLNETLGQRVQAELAKNREKDHLLIRQSRFAAMGEMIGNIAHQWRQPLNTLGLTLANIEDAANYHELTPEYLASQVAEGGRIIQKMSTTIDDFRNFFRPHKEAEPFSANKAIAEAISLVSASFHNHHIAIEWQAGEDAFIQGFANEFSQVLLNLLANAKDAILKNNIENGKVSVTLGRDGAWANVSILDNGGGIPEAILERIFEPYFSTKETGTGIGLYMSKMIIENCMDGEISVSNRAGGTELTVRCRLAGQAQDDAPPQSEA